MLNDQVPEGNLQMINMQESTIRQWEDIVVPVAMEVSQYSSVVDIETGKTTGTDALWIDYFETRTPWMAKQLAKDYQRFDKGFAFKFKENSPVEELSGVDMDYAVAYESLWNTIILAENNKMMRIRFFGYEYSEGEIARIYADYLKSEDSAEE